MSNESYKSNSDFLNELDALISGAARYDDDIPNEEAETELREIIGTSDDPAPFTPEVADKIIDVLRRHDVDPEAIARIEDVGRMIFSMQADSETPSDDTDALASSLWSVRKDEGARGDVARLVLEAVATSDAGDIGATITLGRAIYDGFNEALRVEANYDPHDPDDQKWMGPESDKGRNMIAKLETAFEMMGHFSTFVEVGRE
jgi:hypothetical protein